MKILVTGGCGYLGSHTLIELTKHATEICVVDNLINSDANVLVRVQKISKPAKKISFVNLDIRNFDNLLMVFANFNPDAVIHFAGLKSVSESTKEPLEYYEVNFVGTLNLLKAMDKVGCKNIIFSSSATVYGKPVYLPFDENHPTAPVNPYGWSKLMVEYLLRDWASLELDRKVVALRYFNPVGAHSSGEIGESVVGNPGNIMPIIARVAIGKQDFLSIFGNDYDTSDGTGERDYVHVEDLAEAHVSSLIMNLNSNGGFRILNIGTGKGLTVLELVKEFTESSGVHIPYKFAERRAGDISRYWADVSLAQKVLNWTATKDIKRMCEDTWRWSSKAR